MDPFDLLAAFIGMFGLVVVSMLVLLGPPIWWFDYCIDNNHDTIVFMMGVILIMAFDLSIVFVIGLIGESHA